MAAAVGMGEGLCAVMIRHISASLTIQENADASACREPRGVVRSRCP